ncbi:raffinose/stachyose/melibiose transport system permease protein [Thermosporothrix hazakensis]|uniref:Raffinose/stachyose/melibiose transport system permease protein n=2 Tax=Thermosporothrix TaxID=768650 RepID=A0A326U499_THEHA|nr:carbohydrate ABC transporter permease [Thermosporothrix hazakensis]PZW27473.1 raffinose/stachyose/melibiose transport system permease protein [Thermosporothrix hazakensis]BBH85934.1 sugar ABC transporter permease [Thermosporothrix sp. COM3]GCE45639.1 sugar ABC transporter permease [Thermosporothrix hazakensis]
MAVSVSTSRMSGAKKAKISRTINAIITHAVLIISGLVWIYPFIWTVANSLKTPEDFISNSLNLIPSSPQWSNYTQAWEEASFGQFFMNTAIITITSVFFTVIITAMAGFVLARTSFPGKKLILGIIAVTFFLPHGYTIIPIFDVVQRLGLLNTLTGIILVQTAGGMIFNTFLFMGYFSTLDRELEYAARVDGANFHQLFWRVMFPLARPMIATVGLFAFVSSWNSFLIPLVFTLGVPELRTLAVGLYAFIGEASTDWTLLCAASVIALLPIILVFVVAQKQIINAVAGAVKS